MVTFFYTLQTGGDKDENENHVLPDVGGVFCIGGGGTSFAAEDAGEPFQEDIIDLLGTEGQTNTFYGNGAGTYITTGTECSFFGALAGYQNTTGNNNTFVGYAAGIGIVSGSGNVFIGERAGYNASGSGNVFIGERAGYNETGSEKLYIANTNTTSPLIYGDFADKYLRINGQLQLQTSLTGPLATFFRTGDGDAEIQIGQSTAVNEAAVIGFNQAGAYYYMSVYGLGSNRLVFNSNGYLGVGTTTPSYPLQMASGAYVTTGGVWTNASSREYKKDIKRLSTQKAIDAMKQLDPVEFSYKNDSQEKHVGFIAEDAPELVASKDKKGISSMDVVAVLTKVVQEQQKTIAELSKEMAELKKELKSKGPLTLAKVRSEN
jgi:hypothetical protein